MKTAILFLTIILLYSCTKCATCTQVITTTVNQAQPGYPYTSTSTFKACGDDLKEITGTENRTVSKSGNITTTTVTKTTCK